MQCQAFVATLPASDYGYLLFVPSQRTEDFVYAITQCLKHLGGVPKMLVPDNLKAAVIKTDRYEPSLNRVLEDMATTMVRWWYRHVLSIPRTSPTWRVT